MASYWIALLRFGPSLMKINASRFTVRVMNRGTASVRVRLCGGMYRVLVNDEGICVEASLHRDRGASKFDRTAAYLQRLLQFTHFSLQTMHLRSKHVTLPLILGLTLHSVQLVQLFKTCEILLVRKVSHVTYVAGSWVTKMVYKDQVCTQILHTSNIRPHNDPLSIVLREQSLARRWTERLLASLEVKRDVCQGCSAEGVLDHVNHIRQTADLGDISSPTAAPDSLNQSLGKVTVHTARHESGAALIHGQHTSSLS